VAAGAPVFASQTLTVLSTDPVASQRPSGLIDNPVMAASWALQANRLSSERARRYRHSLPRWLAGASSSQRRAADVSCVRRAPAAAAIAARYVDHGPVKPAFGYRLDHGGRSVAISGDTRPSDNLVAFSKGVDVLIHEVVDDVSLRKLAPSQRLFEAIVGHHTTPEQAAEIFKRVGPRLAVFSHAQGGSAVVDRVRQLYDGRVEMGEDLMVIAVGDEIVVRRHGPGAERR
jgi:ribonuclease BN (tRNA processing enzyme)